MLKLRNPRSVGNVSLVLRGKTKQGKVVFVKPDVPLLDSTSYVTGYGITGHDFPLSHREVMAYVLSRWIGIRAAPQTRLAKFFVSQDMIDAYDNPLTDISPGVYSASVQMHAPGSEIDWMERHLYSNIHEVILLDYVIANIDRHCGNLIGRGRRLYAIDNAFSFLLTSTNQKARKKLNHEIRLLSARCDIIPDSLVRKVKNLDAGKIPVLFEKLSAPLDVVQSTVDRLVCLQESFEEYDTPRWSTSTIKPPKKRR